MREIISLAIGQAGNQINQGFWKIIAGEHGIDTTTGKIKEDKDMQSQKVDVYFSEGQGGRFVPRSVLIDLEPGVLNAVQSNNEMGKLFNPDSFISSQNGAGNNWAKGYFSEGAEIVEDVMDQIRKSAEHCEAMSAF